MSCLPDWFIGASIAIFSFAMFVAWDYFKFRRENMRREGAILAAVLDETESNLERLEANRQMLEAELEMLDGKRNLIAPLHRLQRGAWDLVKINIPKKLMTDISLLRGVREVATSIDMLNEYISSRESFRLHNRALASYNEKLRNMDNQLIELSTQTVSMLKEIRGHFE